MFVVMRFRLKGLILDSRYKICLCHRVKLKEDRYMTNMRSEDHTI